MDGRIILAYDGSINADWVARYAIQMAGTLPSRELQVIHILDGSYSRAAIEAKFAIIAEEASGHGITCHSLIRESEGGVFANLLRAIAPGSQHTCLCGTRVASQGRGFLAGTIAEHLLHCKRFNVIAIRVVSPGLLGCPRTLLFPLAGHPRGFAAALPFLLLLARSVRRLHLLRVMTVNPLQFRYISADSAQKNIALGYAYLDQVMAEIRQQATSASWHVDRHVVLSDDWAKEILIHAGRINAAMILLGVTERSLPSRYFYGNRLEQILRNTSSDIGIYCTI